MTEKYGTRVAFRSSSLKLEDVDCSLWYAITINPSDAHQYWASSDRQKMYVNWAQQTFYRLLLNTDYEMYLEISPLGRLHWHGKIRFCNTERLIKFYMHDIHKLNNLSTFELDSISDEKIWDTYCRKQFKILNCKISSKDKLSKLALVDVESEMIYKKIPLQ